MSIQQFTATIEKAGTKTIIPLPFDPNAVWGTKERHHITGSVNGRPIRGPLASEGGRFFLFLGDAWRRGSGLEAGVTVEVVLSPEGPQAGSIAPDIAAALAAQPAAKAFFESLATFYRNNYVRWIESARQPTTRAARIAEMIALLQAEKKQR